jgi:hypothetical protein
MVEDSLLSAASIMQASLPHDLRAEPVEAV